MESGEVSHTCHSTHTTELNRKCPAFPRNAILHSIQHTGSDTTLLPRLGRVGGKIPLTPVTAQPRGGCHYSGAANRYTSNF